MKVVAGRHREVLGLALGDIQQEHALAFTVLFVLFDPALLFVYMGTSQSSADLTKLGGYFVFSLVVVGAYLFDSLRGLGSAMSGPRWAFAKAELNAGVGVWP